MLKYLLILVVAVIVILAYDAIRIYFLFQKTLTLESSSPFVRSTPNAPFRILVLGDSTAVGTGADKPEDSTAGRLAAAHPNAEVVNLAENGLRIAGLEEILRGREESEHFDIVLIQIGANDIIRMSSMPAIEAGINRILSRADKFGGKVVFLHSGDIGESLFFPWYMRPLLSKRSYAVREIYKKAAAKHHASYIDLISSPVSALLRNDPKRYYSPDLLHLSGEGYGLWFQEIDKQLQP